MKFGKDKYQTLPCGRGNPWGSPGLAVRGSVKNCLGSVKQHAECETAVCPSSSYGIIKDVLRWSEFSGGPPR